MFFGCKNKTSIEMFWQLFKTKLCSVIEFQDLGMNNSIDVAEQRSIKKISKVKDPLPPFYFHTLNGQELRKTGVSLLVWRKHFFSCDVLVKLYIPCILCSFFKYVSFPTFAQWSDSFIIFEWNSDFDKLTLLLSQTLICWLRSRNRQLFAKRRG